VQASLYSFSGGSDATIPNRGRLDVGLDAKATIGFLTEALGEVQDDRAANDRSSSWRPGAAGRGVPPHSGREKMALDEPVGAILPLHCDAVHPASTDEMDVSPVNANA
jgi:hypothetical protein